MFRKNNTDLNHPYLISPPTSHWHSIYFPPKKVNINHLEENGKLLSDEQIAAVQQYREEDNNKNNNEVQAKYYSKKELNAVLEKYFDNPPNIKYSVIFIPEANSKNEKMYAVYLGRSKKKQLGIGAYGTVKFNQNLAANKENPEDTDWIVEKVIQKITEINHKQKIDVDEPVLHPEKEEKLKVKNPKRKNLKANNDNQKLQKRKKTKKLSKGKKNNNKKMIRKEKKKLDEHLLKLDHKNPITHKTSTLNPYLVKIATAAITTDKIIPTRKASTLTTNNPVIIDEINDTRTFISKSELPIINDEDLAKRVEDHSPAYREYQILKKAYSNQQNQIAYFERKSSTKGEQEIILMPWIVDALSLEKLLTNYRTKGKFFTIYQALLFGLKFLNECQELFNKKILHLDIKPENIMIDPDRFIVKLIDFGVSEMGKINEEGQLVFHEQIYMNNVRGTPTYIHPSYVHFMLKLNPDQIVNLLLDLSPEQIGYLLINDDQDFLNVFVKKLFEPIKNITQDQLLEANVDKIIKHVTYVMRSDIKVANILASAILTEVPQDSVLEKHLKLSHAAFKNVFNAPKNIANKPPDSHRRNSILDAKKNTYNKSENSSSKELTDKYVISYGTKKEMYSIGKVLDEIHQATAESDEYFRPLMLKIIQALKNLDNANPNYILQDAIDAWTELTECCLNSSAESISNHKREFVHVDYIKLLAFLKQNQLDFTEFKDKEVILVTDYHHPDTSLEKLFEIKKMFKENDVLVKNQIKVRTSYSLVKEPNLDTSNSAPFQPFIKDIKNPGRKKIRFFPPKGFHKTLKKDKPNPNNDLLQSNLEQQPRPLAKSKRNPPPSIKRIQTEATFSGKNTLKQHPSILSTTESNVDLGKIVPATHESSQYRTKLQERLLMYRSISSRDNFSKIQQPPENLELNFPAVEQAIPIFQTSNSTEIIDSITIHPNELNVIEPSVMQDNSSLLQEPPQSESLDKENDIKKSGTKWIVDVPLQDNTEDNLQSHAQPSTTPQMSSRNNITPTISTRNLHTPTVSTRDIHIESSSLKDDDSQDSTNRNRIFQSIELDKKLIENVVTESTSPQPIKKKKTRNDGKQTNLPSNFFKQLKLTSDENLPDKNKILHSERNTLPENKNKNNYSPKK